MTRMAARGGLALALIAIILASAGWAQPGSTSMKVYYRDKANRDGPEKTVDAEQLKVTPAGVQVINKGTVSTTISADDIIRVDPGDVPTLDRKDIAAQITLEREKNWQKALDTYLDMQKKAKAAGAPAATSRFLEYKVAYTSARVADDSSEDAWKDRTEAAQKLLNDYLIATNYQGGWEVWQIGRMRARMMLELEKPSDGASTWNKLSKSTDVSADLQRRAAFEEIDYLFRANQFPVIEQLITALKPGATGAAKDKLALYEVAMKCAGAAAPNSPTPIAQIVKPLQDMVEQAKDPSVKAVGYNLLGEICMMADKPREAMWNYLWVEVVYNQDRDEVLKAMTRLVKSFDSQGDEDRTRSYREKLRRLRSTL